jgi:hypothetical protein
MTKHFKQVKKTGNSKLVILSSITDFHSNDNSRLIRHTNSDDGITNRRRGPTPRQEGISRSGGIAQRILNISIKRR